MSDQSAAAVERPDEAELSGEVWIHHPKLEGSERKVTEGKARLLGRAGWTRGRAPVADGEPAAGQAPPAEHAPADTPPAEVPPPPAGAAAGKTGRSKTAGESEQKES